MRVGDLHLTLQSPPDFDLLLDAAARDTPDNVDRIPYYANLWPSALALAGWLWGQRAELSGLRVLELGCGLGLPAVVAATLGARVTATDFHPDAGAWCLGNAAANGVALTFLAADWNALPDSEPFDLVIGSDLLYEIRHIPSLTAGISRFCRENGRAVIADPGRQGLAGFVNAMHEQGWTEHLLPHDEIYLVVFERMRQAPR